MYRSFHRWAADGVPLLAGIVASIVLLTFAVQGIWPLAVDVGGQDRRFVAGFHAIEDFGGTSVRWTDGDAELYLPRPAAGPSLLALRLLPSRSPEQPGPTLHLSADGRPVGSFVVAQELAGGRIYRMLLPDSPSLDWAVRLRLVGATFTPSGDQRPLGVVVDRASLGPFGSAPLPPPWLVAWGALLFVLGYGLLRVVGVGQRAALVSVLALVVLLAGGIALRPLEVLPFVRRVALLLAAGGVGIWLARLLAPPLVEGGGWAVRGADLPLYLAVAWWLGPLFQLLMLADGAFNVGPAPATRLIGGGLLIALLVALVGWPLVKGSLSAPPESEASLQPQSAQRAQQENGSALRPRRALRLEPESATVTRTALCVFAAAAAVHLVWMLLFAYTRSGPDFWILFKGARDWARGGSLYDLVAITTNHFGHVFKVPPFYGMLFVPFVFQDGERILLFHRILNTCLIGATFLVWLYLWTRTSNDQLEPQSTQSTQSIFYQALRPVRHLVLKSGALHPNGLVYGAAALLVLFNFRSVADVVAFGQIDLVLLFVLTLALLALRGGRDGLAGALVALGTLFKIYPVLLLAFVVVKGRWRALGGFAAGMFICNGIALAVMGWEMHRVYLFEVLPRIGGATAYADNQTVAGFLGRLVASPKDAAILRNPAVTLLATGLAGLGMLLACALSLRSTRPEATSYALQYSLFLLLMVLAVPAAWMHYQTLLVVPFAALLLHWRGKSIPLRRAAALALAFVLITYGNQWSFYDGTVMGILTVLGISYKFYGMLLLGGVLAVTLLEEPAPFVLPRWVRLPSVPQSRGSAEI